MTGALVMGAVAYDPKVVTIWDGFRTWLRSRGLPFEYILYPHYELQVEALVAGQIQVAWNSPLAWIRAERLAPAHGTGVRSLVMRDTDQDLSSVIVVRGDSPIHTLEDLDGGTVATGAVDSPQATLIPLNHLAEAGVRVTPRHFNVGVGLHGDHIGGEREAARAMMAGEADAVALLDSNHLLFGRERILPSHGSRIVAQTVRYDHCVMTAADHAPPDLIDAFGELLLGMSYSDSAVRQLLDLEGLTSWEKGRTDGFSALRAAVDRSGFYGPRGELTMAGYQP